MLLDSDKPKHDPFAVLRYKEFNFFLANRFFLTLGIQMQSVIVGWQVYALTKDVFALGMIGLTEAIPFIAISLFSGSVFCCNRITSLFCHGWCSCVKNIWQFTNFHFNCFCWSNSRIYLCCKFVVHGAARSSNSVWKCCYLEQHRLAYCLSIRSFIGWFINSRKLYDSLYR